MIIKYHTIRLLNDVLPEVIKNSETQYQWLKSLIQPLKEKQDELNIQQDLFYRNVKHTGQYGSLDHMINDVTYDYLSAKIYFDSEETFDSVIAVTDTESNPYKFFIYTDAETGATYYTPTYFYTDGEILGDVPSFRVLIPDMYEESDIQYGVEHLVNTYKIAGKDYVVRFYSGSTEEIQDDYVNFHTFINGGYTSSYSGFTGVLTGFTGYIQNNHNLAATWLTGSSTFFYEETSTNSAYGLVGFVPDSGAIKTNNFSTTAYNFYTIKTYSKFNGTKQTAELNLHNSSTNSVVVGPLTITPGEQEFVFMGGGDTLYAKLSFTGTDDYDDVQIQFIIEDSGIYKELTTDKGYVVDLDVTNIENNIKTYEVADNMVRDSGTAPTGYTYTKYTGETIFWIGDIVGTYYNIDYASTATGTTIYKGDNHNNKEGYNRFSLKLKMVDNISNLKFTIKNGTTIVDTFEIDDDDLIDNNILYYDFIYNSTGSTTRYLNKTFKCYAEWDNLDGNSILKCDYSFDTYKDQKIQLVLVNNDGDYISSVSDYITKNGSTSIPLTCLETGYGYLRILVSNYDKNGHTCSYNTLTLDNIVINEIDYNAYIT